MKCLKKDIITKRVNSNSIGSTWVSIPLGRVNLQKCVSK